MSGQAIINPWIKGFRPPSKCPFCIRVNTLSYTAIRNERGDHVYHCNTCGKKVGAPTQYAWCNFFDCQLEKDVFHTPCINCPIRQTAPFNPICIYWRNRAWTDLPNTDAISETFRKFRYAG